MAQELHGNKLHFQQTRGSPTELKFVIATDLRDKMAYWLSRFTALDRFCISFLLLLYVFSMNNIEKI